MNPSGPDSAAEAGERHDGAASADLGIVTVNGGSSSIKFAVFTAREKPERILSGLVDRIGSADPFIRVTHGDGRPVERRPIDARSYREASEEVADWLQAEIGQTMIAGVGHRIVHGGIHLIEHQRVTEQLLAELHRAQPLDMTHLPQEIGLVEAFQRRFAGISQVACFDTAFHRDMPRVAKLLPIPRSFDDAGVRRLGFHGLSYSYLMGELRKIAPREAAGKVILAHLGSGASMAAVSGGKPIDTTMGFTPTAGLVMGTRPGDLDPGLLVYLMRVQNLAPEQMDEFISRRCGMVGVSQTSGDMRDLLVSRAADPRADEAVELFCYQARKWTGALAAAMGGLDAVVFSGGIGEHSPEVRAEICEQLQFLGVQLDPSRNETGAPVISADESRVTLRVIATDEEVVIARSVCGVLGLNVAGGE